LAILIIKIPISSHLENSCAPFLYVNSIAGM
jgi:hypothetical protein